jgi:hypothetical protein
MIASGKKLRGIRLIMPAARVQRREVLATNEQQDAMNRRKFSRQDRPDRQEEF